MPVQWPSSIIPSDVQVALFVPPIEHRSANGVAGARQVTFQQRFSFDFSFAPTDVAVGSAGWSAQLRATGDTMVFDIPPSTFGSPLVGIGSAVAAAWNDTGGYILSVKGLASNVAIPDGVPVSIKTGGRWYEYFTGAVAPSGTTRNVTLTGLAKVAHAVNDEVRIQYPVIEGYASAPKHSVDANLLPVAKITVTPP
jgi:hypothetical protein